MGLKKLIGHIGYLFVEAEVYSKKLIEKAEAWLNKKGVTDVHGPLNLNILNGYRLQMEGFDKPAFPGEPRNPSYYKGFLEKSGYKVFTEQDINSLGVGHFISQLPEQGV